MFLQDRPIGPHDRVMAGAVGRLRRQLRGDGSPWRHGACLVPAPRSLVRSGVDPRPVAGGQRGDRRPRRYPPCRVVADAPPWTGCDCSSSAVRPPAGARRPGSSPRIVRCGTPTARPRPRSSPAGPGWSPASRCGSGCRWPAGTWPSSTGPASQCLPVVGELIIGGSAWPATSDPVRDAEVYAPIPTLGWHRAYRSGDLVRFDGAGLLFQGRRPGSGQGRRAPDRARGRIDSGLRMSSRVEGAAAAVRRTEASNTLLVGYVTVARRHPATASTPRLLPSTFARRCRRRSSPSGRRGDTAHPHLREDRPGRAALAAPAAGRVRGRSPLTWRAPRHGWATCGSRSSAARRAGRTRTSSTSAAAAWPLPSWSRCSGTLPEVTIADKSAPIRHRQGSPRSSTSSQPPRPDE